MNQIKNRILFTCFFISFIVWLLPFVIRIFFIEIPEVSVDAIESQNYKVPDIVNEITLSLSKNDYKNAFWAIFKNNIKGCILNIAGGFMFGVGTLINLIYNGFFAADIFITLYEKGVTINTILSTTLPHSFELIGFWLSGGIGFYIAWNIFRFMRGKEEFAPHFYKTVGLFSLFVFFIILLATYVEAYISVNNVK